MKLATKVIAPILAAFIASLIYLAHPGGLDTNGGHTDKKTGQYNQHKDATPKLDQPSNTTGGTGVSSSERTRKLNAYWQAANSGLVSTPLPAKQPRAVSAVQKKHILNRDGNRCVVCGSTTKLEVDHKIALMNGGDNSVANLATLCDLCHTEKTRHDNSLRRNRKKKLTHYPSNTRDRRIAQPPGRRQPGENARIVPTFSLSHRLWFANASAITQSS